jgi:hypothetical protein
MEDWLDLANRPEKLHLLILCHANFIHHHLDLTDPHTYPLLLHCQMHTKPERKKNMVRRDRLLRSLTVVGKYLTIWVLH